MVLTLIAIFLLILLSALFSSSETAFIAASKAKLHHEASQGNEKAKHVRALRSNMGQLISALLMGNTLVNILASSLSTYLFIQYFGDAGVLYATLVMGFLLVLYAEVLPKIIALNYPESLSKGVSSFVSPVVWILSPFTKAIDHFARKTLGIFGLRISSSAMLSSTTDELLGIIDLHGKAGGDAAQERTMLKSILDLDDVWVEEIMVHRKEIFMIDASLKGDEVIRQILESPYTRIPLWQGKPDNIVGILHTKAFLRDVARHKVDINSLNILSLASPLWFVPESTNLLEQLYAFQKRREHFALVIDEYGDVIGMVTLEDILEEIVGDISDELDTVLDGVHKTRDGTYLIEGKTTLRDLNRQLGWKLPDDDAATLAGLIVHESRQIPQPGQIFQLYKFKVKVLKRAGNQITLLHVTP
ncbi:MAG: HlyC/CorC family transporter [bacterium]|nr:HlyC/CorC family transporter [bacterium]